MIGKLPICPFLDGIAIIVEHDLLGESGDQFITSNAFGNPAGALPESGNELFVGQFKPVTGIEQGKTIRIDINRIGKPVLCLAGTFLGIDPRIFERFTFGYIRRSARYSSDTAVCAANARAPDTHPRPRPVFTPHPELGTVIIAITFQMCSHRVAVTVDIVGVDHASQLSEMSGISCFG